MALLSRVFIKSTLFNNSTKIIICYSNQAQHKKEDFLPLNLKGTKGQTAPRRKPKKHVVSPPRCYEMAVDQDWGSVWPGPRTFHPATVPLPIRQGYTEKGAPPGKFANAELMKIPNFLHLTPPVVKRQCEALKKFCTPFPENLKTDEQCEKHFPIEITSSNYCFSSPSIRNPLSRIVTLKIKLSTLNLDNHATDKFRRLVGDRYDEKTDIFTLVTDRCPTRQQNYDYAMYLLTALYHESFNVESWEKLKSEADMEVYIWENNASKKCVEELFGKKAEEIDNCNEYSQRVSELMNEGESEYTLENYGASVRKLFNLPNKIMKESCNK
nr:28S ribosomal protein S35, mitochondrial isoform X1 [Onthophagus taurus]XP_022907882.1 28S ribosomal protein S35, mitochondrial isoform X2 [Onthophagus taurus]